MRSAVLRDNQADGGVEVGWRSSSTLDSPPFRKAMSRAARACPRSRTDPQHRCRLCSADDQDPLVQEVATELWATVPEDGRIWAEVGSYWQHAFRRHAEATIRILRR